MRFLHTADLQIGMPFEWAGEERARPTLKARREEAVERICQLADEHDADFVLIAGDFFDANTVGDDVIVRTCKRLDGSDLPVLILPGNHDFASGPNCVYERDKFTGNTPDNVVVLSERAPHVLADGEVVVLPAPIYEKNEVGDTTAHLTEDFGRDEAEGAIRVGLAHGSVVDFEGGESSCEIAPDRCEQAGLDYLALGDWHGFKQVNERTWYAGAPEPTSFTQNDPGHVALVEIEEVGATPKVEQVATSQTDWVRHTAELREAGDVDTLEQWIQEIERPLDTLVRLELSGTLSISQKTRLDALLSDLEDTVLHLRRRGPGVHPRATPDEIDAIATDGYVREAVEELQAKTNGSSDADDDSSPDVSDDPEARAASEALQMLHRMKNE